MKSLLHKKYGSHFQKDEQGRDIFFPWGHAGDCWYINKTQKTTLRISYVIAVLILCISTLSLGLMTSNFSDESVVITTFNAVLFSWVTFFYFYSKKMEEVKQKAPSIRKPELPKVLSIIFAVLMVYLILGFLKDPSDPLLKISALFVIVVYPLLIWFAQRRRSYLFQKRPPLTEEKN